MSRKDGDIINGIYTYISKPMLNHCIDCDKPIPESSKVMCESCEDKTAEEIERNIDSILRDRKGEDNGKG